MLRRESGFTLVELLVVAAIVSTLAGLAAPMALQAVRQARETRAAIDVRLIIAALERHHFDHGRYPSHLGLLQEYLPAMDFRNPYGRHYFYALRLPGADAYVIGNPSRPPGDPVQWMRAGGSLPEGRPPGLHAYWWGTGGPDPEGLCLGPNRPKDPNLLGSGLSIP